MVIVVLQKPLMLGTADQPRVGREIDGVALQKPSTPGTADWQGGHARYSVLLLRRPRRERRACRNVGCGREHVVKHDHIKIVTHACDCDRSESLTAGNEH